MTSYRKNGTANPADEPGLTERNSRTIRGEEELAGDETAIEANPAAEPPTPAKSGAYPTSYGAAGGTTDATEEGGDGTGI
jgi:hypothetical protein